MVVLSLCLCDGVETCPECPHLSHSNCWTSDPCDKGRKKQVIDGYLHFYSVTGGILNITMCNTLN